MQMRYFDGQSVRANEVSRDYNYTMHVMLSVDRLMAFVFLFSMYVLFFLELGGCCSPLFFMYANLPSTGVTGGMLMLHACTPIFEHDSYHQ